MLSTVLILTLVLVALTDHDAVTRAAIRDAHAGARGPHQGTVVATIAPDATGRPIPRSFLGLSTEYWSLPSYEASHDRVRAGAVACCTPRATARC